MSIQVAKYGKCFIYKCYGLNLIDESKPTKNIVLYSLKCLNICSIL